MKNEQVEISVRNTLNAIIAGGLVPNLLYSNGESPSGLTVDLESLSDIEAQLRAYYSQQE